jgi:alpha-glucosidase
MLNGEIGEYVTIARKERNGETWFIGSITNEKERHLAVPLDFLASGKTYTAEIYRDDDGADWQSKPLAYKIEKRLLTRDSALTMHLAAGGGQAIRVRPATPAELAALKGTSY